ncbi:hypothetical protein BBJ28_00007655 [Nothophytophthora sp. Chile5]|nr:hypothetical protein BBJ28_00007655 [Nothophytophthora sp. Chile5]
MSGAKTLLVLSLLSIVRVQSVPWWSDVGAAHGARATPLTLAELAGTFKDWGIESSITKEFPSGFRQLTPMNPALDSGDSELQPRSSKVPPAAVLDENHDGNTTPVEWTAYVEKLYNIAEKMIAASPDPIARHFLDKITQFHYANLEQCIRLEFEQASVHPIPLAMDKSFDVVSADVESHCYVKFRYSLFAGPPPFELIAHFEPTITAREMEAWFRRHLAVARTDLTEHRVFNLSQENEGYLGRLVACVHEELDTWVWP